MNRLGAFMAYCVGVAIITAGIIHLFTRADGSTTIAIIGIGGGLFGGGLWAKQRGKVAENGS